MRMKIFVGFSLQVKIIAISKDKLDIKINLCTYFRKYCLFWSGSFGRFNIRHTILFQIKPLNRKIKEVNVFHRSNCSP